MRLDELKAMYNKPVIAESDCPVAPRRIILNRGGGGIADVEYGHREPNYMTKKVQTIERVSRDMGVE